MQLSDISVSKFIEIKAIVEAKHYELEIDREIELMSVLTGKPEEHFLSMPMDKFKKECGLIDGVSLSKIEPRPMKWIKAGKRTYAPVYSFQELTAGQFIDINHFIKEPTELIENLPKILASLCVPTKLTFRGRVKLPYLTVTHEDATADFEQASIIDAYGIAVFFYQVWNNLIKIIGASLVKKILTAKTGTTLTKTETAGLLNILETYGDGTTQPNE